MSVHWDNTTPISNDSRAWLRPMVRLLVWVPAGQTSGVRADHVQWGRPDSEEVIKHAKPTPLGALQPWTLGLHGIIDSKLQAMMTQSNASCECSGYNTPNENMVYTKIKKGLRPPKKEEKNNLKNYPTFHWEERLVNLGRGRECLVGLSILLVVMGLYLSNAKQADVMAVEEDERRYWGREAWDTFHRHM